MSRPLRLPRPESSLHLYRHLLREASYLPSIARPFADGQIRDRFRQHRKDEEDKCRRQVQEGHHQLRLLRAANAGDTNRMRRLLLRALGRVGRRRRELMADVLRPDEIPADIEHLARAADKITAAAEGRKSDFLDAWDREKLRWLARAQVRAGLINNPKADISAFQTMPEQALPKENAWGRPLPPKLERTKLKKVWKSLADKCMPPLPREEWELLGRLAEGKLEEQDGDLQWLPSPRRAVAQSLSSDGQRLRDWDWRAYAVKPVAIVDYPANRRSKLLTGAVDDNTPTGDPEPVGCHNYTPRSWRRLLSSVWPLTATMEKHPGGFGWDVVWGKSAFQPVAAGRRNMEFFKDFPRDEEAKSQQRQSGRTRRANQLDCTTITVHSGSGGD